MRGATQVRIQGTAKAWARTLGIVLWLAAAGTALEARTAAEARTMSASASPPMVADECVFINGQWYCPCEESECIGSDCIVIEEQWYCAG